MLEVDAYDFNIYDPGINGDNRRQEYIDHLLGFAIHKRDITLGPNDHIILLSTCFLDVSNGRHIVVAKITDTVPKDTFHLRKIKTIPLIVSFDDSSLGRFLSSIPLWIWYIILFILFCYWSSCSSSSLWSCVVERSKGRRGRYHYWLNYQ